MHNTFLSRSGKALIYDTITSISIERGIARCREMMGNEANRGILLGETDLNSLGYQLLREGKVEAAIAIFELNVEEFPESWNVYDSLAEGYMTAGKNAQAIAHYTKSLELNPDNRNGSEMLKRLQRE
jgi:tetratricopeptide (TPR) repeat protein